MDFINDMNRAIGSSLADFRSFIEQKHQENPQFLNQYFWVSDEAQLTVLNYLILKHQEDQEQPNLNEPVQDLKEHIDYVLELSTDKKIGAPLHQAVSTKKIQLALHLLANPNHLFDLDARDVRGQTLISLVLDTKNEDLLKSVLAKKIKVNQPTYKTRNQILVQPLHQAVTMNFAEGVRLLAQHHAQLNNPVGPMRDTPLLLAARQGKMKSLQVLLEFPPKHLALEAENTHSIKNQQNGLRAIEELCIHFKNKQQTQEALRSIAMLLCCGAEPPRSEEMRHLLSSNRVALLKAVDVFLKDKPQYVDAFVNRCHLKESALHNIVYADHSWSSSIRHLFGKPSDAALVIEGFVTKKYSNPLDKPRNAPQISSIAGSEAGVDDPLKLYAEFVRRYTDTYNNQKIANRWSTMRWMIAEGKADWEIVCRYAENHPSSRTHLVLTEMCPAQPSMHEDIDVENAASPEFSH